MKDAAFVTVEATHIDRKEWEARSSFVNCQGVKPRNVDLSHSRSSDFGGEPYEILDLEIDRGCWDGSNEFLAGRTADGTIPLFAYHEIPSFLQGNPYIIKGYRVLLPFSVCFQSLFVWSNETVNIWSHLLGCVFFFMLLFYDNLIGIPENGGSTADHIICSTGVLCFMFCLLCSAGFHLFNCHSERACNRWLALDLTGVSVGLVGCYLPGIHYGYYCTSIWRDVYLLSCCVLFAAVLFFQMSPRFLSWRWYRRVGFYCAVSGYGMIPAIHWVQLNGGASANIVQVFFPKVVVMYIIGALAFFFYITKFPEKFYPGRFDFLGSSHQIWHGLVMLAFFWWHQAGRDILEYRTNNPCGDGAI